MSDIHKGHNKGIRKLKSGTVGRYNKVGDHHREGKLVGTIWMFKSISIENAYFLHPNKTCLSKFQEGIHYLLRESRSRPESQSVSPSPSSPTLNPSAILSFPSKTYPKSIYYPIFPSTSTSSHHHLSGDIQ